LNSTYNSTTMYPLISKPTPDCYKIYDALRIKRLERFFYI